jgi:hypothetical protein
MDNNFNAFLFNLLNNFDIESLKLELKTDPQKIKEIRNKLNAFDINSAVIDFNDKNFIEFLISFPHSFDKERNDFLQNGKFYSKEELINLVIFLDYQIEILIFIKNVLMKNLEITYNIKYNKTEYSWGFIID